MQKRKELILRIIKDSSGISIRDVLEKVNSFEKKKVAKVTINRDLKNLVNDGLVIRKGKGPAVKYAPAPSMQIQLNIDVEKYFLREDDQREIIKTFNFEIFNILELSNIFNKNELTLLEDLNNKYRNNINKLPQDIIKREFERLLIELSWKSSKIEGNTYSLLETEFLIRENREAAGHTKLEAQMILNHKKAFEFIKNNQIINASIQKIKKVHNLLIEDMNISENIRHSAVGITGTRYRPLKEQKLIEKSLKKLCKLVNNKNNIFEKAFLLNLLIAYIQPFNDGNKRTSRLMGNAVLLANNYCPLSFRSIDDLEYKKAVIIFYEQNNIIYFKDLFMQQFQFSVENYFQ